MAPTSLKKTRRVRRVKEGNYASSEISDMGRESNCDLGLTLLPGSQILKTGEEALEAMGSGKLNSRTEKWRRQKQNVDPPVQIKDGPTAQRTSLLLKIETKPRYYYATLQHPCLTSSSERQASSQDPRQRLIDEEFIAEHSVVGNFSLCDSKDLSSFKAISGGRGCLQIIESGLVESRDASKDLSPPKYTRKRRRVRNDEMPGQIPESTIGLFPTVSDRANQLEYCKESRHEKVNRHATQARSFAYAHGLPPLHQFGRERSRLTIGTRNDPVTLVSGPESLVETVLEGSSKYEEVVALIETCMKTDLLKDSSSQTVGADPDSESSGEVAIKDQHVSCVSAKHRSQMQTNSTQVTNGCHKSRAPHLLRTDSSLAEIATRTKESLARVESGVVCIFVCPLASTPYSSEEFASANSLHNLGVEQDSQPSRFSKHHFKPTHYTSSTIYNHLSSAFDVTSGKSSFQSSICDSFPYPRHQRSLSTTSAPSANHAARGIHIIQPRRRANSVPIAKAIPPEAGMNNFHIQQNGIATPENSPPKWQTINPDCLQFYQRPGNFIGSSEATQDTAMVKQHQQGNTNGTRQKHGHNPSLDIPSRMPSGLIAHPESSSHNRAEMQTTEDNPLLTRGQSATMLGRGYTAQVAREFLVQKLTSYLISEAKISALSQNDIATSLNALVLALPSRLHVKGLVYRIVKFVHSFTEAGTAQWALPDDEVRVMALEANENLQKHNIALQVRCTEYEKLNTELQRKCIQQHKLHEEKERKSADEKEQLRSELQEWKTHASNGWHLAKNPPPKPPCNNALYQRILPGDAIIEGPVPLSNAHVSTTGTLPGPLLPPTVDALPDPPMLGNATAAFQVGCARKDSSCSSGSSSSSNPIDLTLEDDSTAVSSSSNTSATMPREPSSQSQPSKAMIEFTEGVTRRRSGYPSWLPKMNNDALHVALVKETNNQRSVIDIDKMPEPFVPNFSEDFLNAAEANKNNISYASYQQKTRVNKTAKVPKLTKKQQKEIEKSHAPAPKNPRKKARKERMSGKPETALEKKARLEQEEKDQAQKALEQAAQFERDALDRQEREEREVLELEDEMDGLLCSDDFTAGANDNKEVIACAINEQVAAKATDKISNGLAKDNTIPDAIDNLNTTGAGEIRELGLIEAGDDLLDALFELDNGMSDAGNIENKVSVTETGPATAQAQAPYTNTPQMVSATVLIPQAEIAHQSTAYEAENWNGELLPLEDDQNPLSYMTIDDYLGSDHPSLTNPDPYDWEFPEWTPSMEFDLAEEQFDMVAATEDLDELLANQEANQAASAAYFQDTTSAAANTAGDENQESEEE